MTKKEIIKAIQVAEARAWSQYQSEKREFGSNSRFATEAIKAWGTLYDLREELGIESLPVSEALDAGLLIM
jgi:hypothetical protein